MLEIIDNQTVQSRVDTTTHPTKSAFSLVELSIVLVILGLLVGGVLTGRSLIESATIRSQIVQMQGYSAAVQQFRDKYFALPGDMLRDDAVKFNFPVDWSNHGDPYNVNGDGSFNTGWTGTTLTNAIDAEVSYFWSQLAAAQLIPGSYTALGFVPGINMPSMKLAPAFGILPYTAAVPNFGGNWFILGVQQSPAGWWGCACWAADTVGSGTVLPPTQAWIIDTKIDDGKPSTGGVRAVKWASDIANDDGNAGNFAAKTCVTTATPPQYNVQDPTPQCLMMMRM